MVPFLPAAVPDNTLGAKEKLLHRLSIFNSLALIQSAVNPSKLYCHNLAWSYFQPFFNSITLLLSTVNVPSALTQYQL